MEGLYHHSQKLVQEIHDYLPQVERNVGHEAANIEQIILSKLEEITR